MPYRKLAIIGIRIGCIATVVFLYVALASSQRSQIAYQSDVMPPHETSAPQSAPFSMAAAPEETAQVTLPAATPTAIVQSVPAVSKTPALLAGSGQTAKKAKTAPPATPARKTTATAKPTPAATLKSTAAPTPKRTPAATAKPTEEPQPTEQPAPGEEPQPGESGLSAKEEAMIGLVNRERAAAGLPELTLDTGLRAAARKHSADMSAHDYFSHTSPTYGSFSERLAASGVSHSTAGENIAMYASVEDAHEGLMHSEGHRANILGEQYTRIGIGIVYNSERGMYYITQWFAG